MTIQTGMYVFNDQKFWELMKVEGGYQARYGKMGSQGQLTPVYDEKKALKKCSEKRAKGYTLESSGTETVTSGSGESSKKGPSVTYTPVRAVGKRKIDDKNIVAEEKFDGARYVYYSTPEGHFLISRSFDVNGDLIDKADRVPHLFSDKNKELDVVLDGEVFAGRQSFEAVNGVMLALPSKSIPRQYERGHMTFVAFDVLQYKGEDFRERPYSERRKVLERVVKELNKNLEEVVTAESGKKADPIRCPQIFTKSLQKKFDEIVAAGGEGLILKDTTKPYGHSQSWTKMKRNMGEISCVVMELKESPTNPNTLGSLKVGLYKDGKLVSCGSVAGINNDDKEELWNNKERYVGMACDVTAMEMTAKGQLRQSSFIRMRPDIENPKTCTLEKVRSEVG